MVLCLLLLKSLTACLCTSFASMALDVYLAPVALQQSSLGDLLTVPSGQGFGSLIRARRRPSRLLDLWSHLCSL